DVEIGKYCWIGMGAVILPGVKLGEYTIVAAGAIVTKSFENGYCVVGGNPAKVLKELNPADCQLHRSDFEYHGYLPASKFQDYRKKYLNV
ncbi:MAG: acyltransferase, partial [Saprospiraceae bacterium]|nr:acyltransferase [Saprospiraceae bacterium]